MQSKRASWLVSSSRTLFNVFSSYSPSFFPNGIYLFKVNNENAKTKSEICSKLTIMTPEWRQELLKVALLTSFWWLYCQLWTDSTHCPCVFIVGFEQVNASWVGFQILSGNNKTKFHKKSDQSNTYLFTHLI